MTSGRPVLVPPNPAPSWDRAIARRLKHALACVVRPARCQPIPYIILSYPRSGNHWVRYIVEWATGRPTLGAGDGEHWRDRRNRLDVPIHQLADLPHVAGRPIAKKRHLVNDWDSRSADLVFILRNYKECVTRHLETMEVPPDHPRADDQLRRYLAALRQYDEWRSRKLLLPYADLVENPTDPVRKLLGFLGEDVDKADQFGADIDRHRTNAMRTLKTASGSGGRRAVHHLHKLEPAIRQQWDLRVRELAPDLWDLYLAAWSD